MNTERPGNDDPEASGDSRHEPGVDTPPGDSEAVDDAAGSAQDAADGKPVDAPDTAHAAEGIAAEAAGTGTEAGGDPPANGTPDAAHAQDTTDTDRATTTTRATTGTADDGDASGVIGIGPAVIDRTPDSGGSPEEDRRRPAGSGSPGRSAVLVASVVAAVLALGGGGAYLVARGGGDDGKSAGAGAGGGGTPPPLALDGYGASDSSSGGNGIAPGEPNPYGVTYRASGKLPEGPGSGAVYRPDGEVAKTDVVRLAEALKVDGTPVVKGGAWWVGTGKDGSGPVLRVNQEAPGSWTFSRYAPGTDNCKKVTVCAQDPAVPAVDTVSVAAARKAAAPVLKALGQDDAKIDASQVMGAQRVVNADPVVGGLPTHGWTTGLTVGVQGEVVGGSGMLTTPVKEDTYPALSADRTLDLMNSAPRTDHRMGIGGCASPVPLKDRLEKPCGSSGSSAPAKDSSTATVEHAVFGLAAHSVRGQQALVPSWLFEVRGAQSSSAFTVTYPAIDPKYLTSASSPASSPSSSSPSASSGTRNAQVTGYSADGKNLTVTFTGGVCADYSAAADETSDRVKVTVTEKPWPNKVCELIAKEYKRTVQLHEPLGSREVVGSDGKEIRPDKA